MENDRFEGFGESSGLGERPGLLVIDFMKGFTNPNTQLGSDLEQEITASKNVLHKARAYGIPIIFTNIAYEPHFKDGAHFVKKIPALKLLTIGNEATEIDDRLDRQPDSEVLITKKFASAFFGTHLLSVLNHERIDTLIIIGATTSGCVRATAVDGVQYGYQVIVLKDCVGDRSKHAHDANLYDINTKYGDVITSMEAINYIKNLKGDGVNV